jgi:uncharacterized protein (DUF2249 family)
MKISAGTKISEIIKHNPEAIEVIASINPHFAKLRNPILRKILAHRVTIRDAARIGGCSIEVFLDRLKSLGFEVDSSNAIQSTGRPADTFIPRTTDDVYDVRDDLSKGIDPFNTIMARTKKLKEGETLLIINSFEPAPLIKILRNKGFRCSITVNKELFHTYITKEKNADLTVPADETADAHQFNHKKEEFEDRIIEIDVSELQMPAPMLKILDELKKLPENFALLIHHRKFPQFLIPELAQLGAKIVYNKITDTRYDLLIYR